MKQVDFENGTLGQNIAQTSLPMLVAQILSLLYNIVDRIYIARIPGEGTLALGGVGLCFPIIMIILGFTNLFGIGGAPLCSMALGAKDRDKAARIMNTSFCMLVLTGLVLMLLGLALGRPLLFALGASDTTIRYALPYLQIYLLGSIPSMIATGLNPYINAQGFPGTGMLTIFIGAAANIVLDPLFIFVFGMGVSGAAVATVISQCLSALYVISFLRGPKAGLKLDFGFFHKLEKKTIGDIAGLGTASFVFQVTNSLVAVVCNRTLSRYGGDLYISIYTIVSSVHQLTEVPVSAITDGASPILSYNYGAKRFDKIKRAIWILVGWAGGYALVVWLLVIIFPAFFIRIFSSDETLMQTAIPALHTYFFAFIFQSFQHNGQMVFRSLNKKKQAVFFSIFRKVILVAPLSVILPMINGYGAMGVFMAEPISNVVGGLACFITMMLTVYRNMDKEPQAKDPARA